MGLRNRPRGLVDPLPPGSLVSGAHHLLQWRQVIVVAPALIVLVDDESQLDHAVDAPENCVGSSRLKPEARTEVSKSRLIRSFTCPIAELRAASEAQAPLVPGCC